MKEFADDSSNFDEKRGKLSKRVENAVGKGENARDEQFLLCPTAFSKDYKHVKRKVWERLNVSA